MRVAGSNPTKTWDKRKFNRFHVQGPGRPKGSRPEKNLLQEAIKVVEKDPLTICNCQMIVGGLDLKRPRCKTVREHFIRRGLLNDQVIGAVLKKLEPDLVYETGAQAPTVINVVRIYKDQAAIEPSHDSTSTVRAY